MVLGAPAGNGDAPPALTVAGGNSTNRTKPQGRFTADNPWATSPNDNPWERSPTGR